MKRPWILLLNVLIVATCGLIYELLAATVASYTLGDSVMQFSLVIGIYLSALGIGAWLSKYVITNLPKRFVEIELLLALVGGFSAPLLFVCFNALNQHFEVALYAVVLVVGTLVGLEIPILMRILQDKFEFKDLVSRVLTFDYIGALLASILFPLFFLPKVGAIRTSLMFGLLNAFVGIWASYLMAPMIKGVTGVRVRGVIVVALLALGLYKADWLTMRLEENMFSNPIVYTHTTPYQRIIVTSRKQGFQLFLNGHLQFNAADEYRYHEALTHPAMIVHGNPRRVLILGGGDGLGLREILKYKSVHDVTLVDLDPGMTELSTNFPALSKLNGNSMSDKRVTVINRDAMKWLELDDDLFDIAIIDFPDPGRYEIGKLYTTRFYRLLQKRLAPGAMVSVQSTSPLMAREAYWCIVRTMEAAKFNVRPYNVPVPSFGIWGYALARMEPFDPPAKVPSMELKYLNDTTLQSLFVIPEDMGPVPVEINRLDNQVLVRYHNNDWGHWD